MRAQLRALAPAGVAAAGAALPRLWRSEPSLAGLRRIALYAALPDELPTRPLFDALRAGGCEVLMPRCAVGGLEFAWVEDWRQLAPGRHGILEPLDTATRGDPMEADAVLVPGLAFDRRGGRLGRGAGWYDRCFESDPTPHLIGAGFALQVVDAVPVGPCDRQMGAILTERRFFRTGMTGEARAQ